MRFLDLIPRWVPLLAMAGLGALAGWQTLALHAEEAAHAQTRATHSEEVAEAALATAEDEREQRRIESRRASLAQEIAHDHLRTDARNRAVADALRADRERLRIELASYAAGPGDAGGDSLAACLDRSARLGNALDEALRAEEEATGAAESYLATAHGLHRWAEGLSQP